mgnify:CR=1 FL=1
MRSMGNPPISLCLASLVMFLSSLAVLESKYSLVGIPIIYAWLCVCVCVCVCVCGSWPGDMWARPWRGCITDFPNFHKAFGTTPHKRLFQSIQGLGIPSVYTIKWQANCILSWACQCRVGKWCPLTRKMHFIVGLSLWVSGVYEVLPTLVTAFFPIAPCRMHKWISILPQNTKNKRRTQWNCWYCPNKKNTKAYLVIYMGGPFEEDKWFVLRSTSMWRPSSHGWRIWTFLWRSTTIVRLPSPSLTISSNTKALTQSIQRITDISSFSIDLQPSYVPTDLLSWSRIGPQIWIPYNIAGLTTVSKSHSLVYGLWTKAWGHDLPSLSKSAYHLVSLSLKKLPK